MRTAFALAKNVASMAEEWGLESLVFLTLTFADHVLCIREAQRRFNSLRTHVLAERYRAFIAVVERQKSGRVHFHLVCAIEGDVRTGVDFEEFKRGNYKSAGSVLRAEWSFWRRTAKLYRFGRTEVLPIRSTSEGISKYVGKYIAKHMGARAPQDARARLVRYSRAARKCSTRFAWISPRAWLWRAKLAKFAQAMGCESMEELKGKFGPRWAYGLAESITAETLVSWPNKATAEADGETWPDGADPDAPMTVTERWVDGRCEVKDGRPVAAGVAVCRLSDVAEMAAAAQAEASRRTLTL